jgi:hypothetical protein
MAMEIALPTGVVLAKDESAIRTTELSSSNIMPFLRTKLVLTSRRVVGDKRNTILGLIPTGTERVSFPLPSVAGVRTRTSVSVPGLLLGALLTVAAIASLNQGVGAVVILIVGALIFASAFGAEIVVQNSGGGTIPLKLSVMDRNRAVAFCEEVNTLLASR